MTAWANFYPFVHTHVRGVPAPMVNRALCDAARQFCSESRFWVEASAPVNGDGTEQEFPIVLAAGTELVRLQRVTVGGRDYSVVASRDMPADWLEDEPKTGSMCSAAVLLPDESAIRVYGPPPATEDIVMYLALAPTLDATEVGDVVYQRYAEPLAYGAVMRLKSMSDMPWTDPDGAATAAAVFARGVTEATYHEPRQGVRRRMRARTF